MILAGMPKQDAVPNIKSARQTCEGDTNGSQATRLALNKRKQLEL